MAFDPEVRVVATVGDVDPLNEGGAILDSGDGRPVLVYFVEAGETEYDSEQQEAREVYLRFTVDVLDAETLVNERWVELKNVARSCGWRVEDMRADAMGTLKEKAYVLMAIAGYHGWESLDTDPGRYTSAEVEEWTEGLRVVERRPARAIEEKGGEV